MDLRRRAAYLDEHVNLRGDRSRSHSHATLERMQRLVRRAWATRSTPTRSIHVTGTNGKGSTAQMITRLLDGPRPDRRHLHQPAPRADQRAHHPQRRADQRRRASPSRSPAIADLEVAGRRAAVATSRSLTAAAFRWFADVAVDVAVSRSACSAGGTPPTSSTARSRSSPTSASTTPSSPGRRWPTSPREKAGIVKPGSHARARRDRPGAGRRSSAPTARRERLVARRATSTCDENQLAARRPPARPAHARRRSTPSVFLPLHGAPPGRQRRGRAGRGRGVLRRAARRPTSSREGFADVVDARALRGRRPPAAGRSSTAPTTRPAPTSRRRSLVEDFDAVGRTHPASSGCCAAAIPRRCSRRCDADELDARDRCTAAVAARAIPAEDVAARGARRSACDVVVESTTSSDGRATGRSTRRRRRRRGAGHRLALRRRRRPAAASSSPDRAAHL